jgi:hypothetical protein
LTPDDCIGNVVQALHERSPRHVLARFVTLSLELANRLPALAARSLLLLLSEGDALGAVMMRSLSDQMARAVIPALVVDLKSAAREVNWARAMSLCSIHLAYTLFKHKPVLFSADDVLAKLCRDHVLGRKSASDAVRTHIANAVLGPMPLTRYFEHIEAALLNRRWELATVVFAHGERAGLVPGTDIRYGNGSFWRLAITNGTESIIRGVAPVVRRSHGRDLDLKMFSPDLVAVIVAAEERIVARVGARNVYREPPPKPPPKPKMAKVPVPAKAPVSADDEAERPRLRRARDSDELGPVVSGKRHK